MADPTVTLTTPWQDPPNTFRAATTNQTFSLLVPGNELDYQYQVGIASTISTPFKIRNNSVNTSLTVEVSVPKYLLLDTPLTFILAPSEIRLMTMTISESAAQALSMVARQQKNIVSFTVTPMAGTGPIYIADNLPTTF